MEDVPRGVHINFLKAERSLHRWAIEDLHRIHVAEEQAAEEGGGVEMHVLEDAGHWVCIPISLYKLPFKSQSSTKDANPTPLSKCNNQRYTTLKRWANWSKFPVVESLGVILIAAK